MRSSSEPSSDAPTPSASTTEDEHTAALARRYWRANKLLIGGLLLIWAGVSYGCGILLIDWLNQFMLGHLPLGFWFAQQGAILTFVALVLIYALSMDGLDRKYGWHTALP